MSFAAFHLTGFGRLVVCESHVSDVWMWLWMDQDMTGQLFEPRGNDRGCALCSGSRCPQSLEDALARQGRQLKKGSALKRAA